VPRQKRTCGSSPAGHGKASACAGGWSARAAPAGNMLNNETARKQVPTRIGLHRPPRCCRARDSQLGACYQSVPSRVKPGRALGLALTVLGGLAGGCGEAPPPPGSLVVAFDSDPESLDPRFQTDANGARLADLLYAGLTRADATGRRVPDLARAWEMADSRSFVFRLRPDFRFPDGAPKLHTLVVRIVPDELVRVLELRRGGVHLVEDAPEPEMVAWLGTVPSLLVRRTPGTSFVYLALNLRDPRLADRRVRQAITLALDRAGLVRFVLGGAARPATGLLAPEHWAYAPARPPRHDLRRARRLLDLAGYR